MKFLPNQNNDASRATLHDASGVLTRGDDGGRQSMKTIENLTENLILYLILIAAAVVLYSVAPDLAAPLRERMDRASTPQANGRR